MMKGIEKFLLEMEKQPTYPWENLASVLSKHHHKPDLEAVRAVYAACAAHRLNGSPVWTMNVAPPGSMKTELIEALDGLPGVHLIDQITANTFISGQIDDPKNPRKQPASLLHRIGSNGILIYPDFSTILGMKRDHKASILADMRRIYDGKLRKEYGYADSPKERIWEGRITFLVAATPDVDRHYGIFQTLGERFLMVRSSRPGGIEAALKAMNQDGKKVKEELRDAAHSLFNGLQQFEPVLSPEYQLKIAALTEVTVRGRTHTPRNGYTKDIIYVPEPEAATRLAQQLAQLAKGSALLDGRKEVSESDFQLVKRVAFDCIPASKRKILEAGIAREDLDEVNLPESTRTYAIEDLQSQQLINEGKLSDLACSLLWDAGVI